MDNLQEESAAPEPQDDQSKVFPIQAPPDDDQSERSWIRYRTEYRDQRTNDVVWEQNSRTPIDDGHDGTVSMKDPIFEILTTYRARGDSTNAKIPSQLHDGVREGPPPRSFGTPAYHKLRIYSPAIRNALNSVVEYYPSQPLNGDVLEINWPYPVLVHHYDELTEFRREVLLKEASDLCAREIHADEDIQALLTYLDETVMDDVKAEMDRNKRGFMSFDNLWYSHKPGTTIISSTAETPSWRAWVVKEVSGGTFIDPPGRWVVRGWSLAYDGMYLGRVDYTETTEKFSGELELKWTHFITDTEDIEDEEAKKLVDYGRLYWDLVEKQCKYHIGDSCNFPYNKVSKSLCRGAISIRHTFMLGRFLATRP